jgi:hypothetical protein
LRKVLEPVPSPHVATLLSQNQIISEASLHGIVSFCRWNAPFHFESLAQLAVQVHLLLKVSIKLPAAKQHQEPSANFS